MTQETPSINKTETPSKLPPPTPESTKVKPKSPDRVRWIDQGRGFIMLYLVICEVFPPGIWKSTYPIVFWLTGHPGSHDVYMTLYDVGAAAFIFILGLLFSVSFYKTEQKGGRKLAIMHVFIRYGLIFVLGFAIMLVDGSIIYENEGYTNIVRWDVIPTLGFVGIVALPFVIYIKDPKFRIIAAYAWLLLYQILMIYAGLKGYAQASIHAGIFGTIFGYAAILIVASAVGDYIFDPKVEERKKYTNFAIFGLMNLILGLAIAYIPGWEASKRQASFTHGLISIGVTMVGGLIFVLLDRKFNKDIRFLRVYGQNPFMTYLMAIVPVFILDEFLEEELSPLYSFLLAVILVAYTGGIMYYLDSRKKIISTEKVAAIFILVVGGLAALLLGTGLVKL